MPEFAGRSRQSLHNNTVRHGSDASKAAAVLLLRGTEHRISFLANAATREMAHVQAKRQKGRSDISKTRCSGWRMDRLHEITDERFAMKTGGQPFGHVHVQWLLLAAMMTASLPCQCMPAVVRLRVLFGNAVTPGYFEALEVKGPPSVPRIFSFLESGYCSV